MKIGDRVKIANTDYMSEELQPGQEGVIVDVVRHRLMDVFLVKMDNGYLDMTGDPLWAFFHPQLEVL